MFRNVLAFLVEEGYRWKIWPYFARTRIPFFWGWIFVPFSWRICFFASTLFGWGQWNVHIRRQKLVLRFHFRPLNSYVEPCCHNHLATWISYFVAKMDLTIDPSEDHHLENPCHHSFRWATMQSCDFSSLFSPYFCDKNMGIYRFNYSSLSLFCIFCTLFLYTFNGNCNIYLLYVLVPMWNLYHTCDMTHTERPSGRNQPCPIYRLPG